MKAIKNGIFVIALVFTTLALLFVAVYFVEAILGGISISNAQGVPITGEALTVVVNEIMAIVARCALALGIVSLAFNLFSYFIILSHVHAKKKDIVLHMFFSVVIVIAGGFLQLIALHIWGNQILKGYNYSLMSVTDAIFAGVLFGTVMAILAVGTCWKRIYRCIKNRSDNKRRRKKNKEIIEDGEL